ncbi:MAG: 50S ribosomal protein L22 [bacterium]
MEARAVTKYVRMSPKKARRVVDLVRGIPVDRALNVLHFTQKAACVPVEKTLRSAVANMLNNEGASKVEPEHLFVKEAYVDMGFSFRRFRAASMGRAMRMRRPTCHITIVVATAENSEKTVA